MTEPAFDVFLCHNSHDKPAVKRVAEQLRERGLRPWFDVWELQPGLPWQRTLEAQIRSIGAAAVFVGTEGRGPWQELEIEAFLRQFVKRDCPVIPVILPDGEEVPELPVFLEGMMWVDFRVESPDPMDQLVWGITGKKPASEDPRAPTPQLPPQMRRIGSAALREPKLFVLRFTSGAGRAGRRIRIRWLEGEAGKGRVLSRGVRGGPTTRMPDIGLVGDFSSLPSTTSPSDAPISAWP